MSFSIKAAFDGSAVTAGVSTIVEKVHSLKSELGGVGDVGQKTKRSLGELGRSFAGFAAPVASLMAGLRLGESIFSGMEKTLLSMADASERISTSFNRGLLSPELGKQADDVQRIQDAINELERTQSTSLVGNDFLGGIGANDQTGERGFGAFLQQNASGWLRKLGVLPQLDSVAEQQIRRGLQAELERQAAVRSRLRDQQAADEQMGRFQRLGSFANAVDAFGAGPASASQRIEQEFGTLREKLAGLQWEDYLFGGGRLEAAIRAQIGELESALKDRLGSIRAEEESLRASAQERLDVERELAEIESLRARGLSGEADELQRALETRRKIRDLERFGAENNVDPTAAIEAVRAAALLGSGSLSARGGSVASASVGGFDSGLVARSFLGGSPQERIAQSAQRQVALAEQANRHLQVIADRVGRSTGGLA